MLQEVKFDCSPVPTSLLIGEDLLPCAGLSPESLIKCTVASVTKNPESASEIILAAASRLVDDPQALRVLVVQVGSALDRISQWNMSQN